jgi:cytidylate kinase|eukprot:CAMPEP_0195285568 /NCGR_PEP_ID=MMETSP0707-20130614/3356_1 /TAXON_ID=33640 /ORGANISM="Asterionellopsis glacialis, Strain CCMP134" /LENGTH=344 /DNA_ID=CAMNT_0040345085 /DNA_START=157 /DNA_END=1191 /DNA_ORIENTATION=+
MSPFPPPSPPQMTLELLKQQNATTSNAILETFASNPSFRQLAEYEGTLTVNRDREDEDKLQVGIDYAKSKGVLDPHYIPEPYVQIDVLGKTPQDVAQLMLDRVNENSDSNSSSSSSGGSVIVLCGLSGTGKGTTVEVLKHKLIAQQKVPVSWSNGNVFRSVTLLATTWCEQQCHDHQFDKDKALTAANLQSFMKMLSFGKFNNNQWDIQITGLGYDKVLVSDIQNTLLKSPQVSKHIPTVAQMTQGEVVMFAADAVQQMSAEEGVVVLLEGREQTVNYVRTPLRFTLMLSDESLIGKRRAAQRLMAAALDDIVSSSNDTPPKEEDKVVREALESALVQMVKDIE